MYLQKTEDQNFQKGLRYDSDYRLLQNIIELTVGRNPLESRLRRENQTSKPWKVLDTFRDLIFSQQLREALILSNKQELCALGQNHREEIYVLLNFGLSDPSIY